MTTTTPDPNAFLMGGGAKSAKFTNPGDKVDGIITATEVTQQTDFKTGAPKNWDDGKPMMQLVITLQTEDREDPDDDGIRRLFCKGSVKRPTTLGAVRTAVTEAGVKELAVGGRLQVVYTGDGEKSNPAMNAPKEYKAKYDPPAEGSVDVDAIFS